VADIENEIRSKSNWVSNFDLEKEIRQIMKRYRPQLVEEKEEVVE
jgi:hypothetical protein